MGSAAQSLEQLRRGYRRVRLAGLWSRGIARRALARACSATGCRRCCGATATMMRWTSCWSRCSAFAPRTTAGQLLTTLRAWCAHDGQSQACADALGIHRNSLRYRLERIAELGEVDPLRMDGMLSLYLGLQLLPAD